MGKVIKKHCTDSNGEIMLEAVIVLVPVLILLMALLALSFLFYQQSVMTTVASEIAADVAKNYKFTSSAVGKNNITPDDSAETNMFRMAFGKTSTANKHKERAEAYVVDRIELTSLGLDSEDVEVECNVKISGIGRAYVEVKVSQKTDTFLSGILEFSGIAEKNNLFSATAYAECSDLMGYSSSVNFTRYMAGKLEPFDPIGSLYLSIKNLAEALMD